MNNKIPSLLIVVESLDINDSSATKGRIALINNLHHSGFKLKVYHYTRKAISLPNIHCVEIPERKWSLMYFLSRTERMFSRWTGINLNPFLEGFFGFSFTFFNDTSSILRIVRKESSLDYDFVLTLSKGASFRTHYALLKIPTWHYKWIAYVHDPYPFHCYPPPYKWLQPGFRQKELFFKKVSQQAKYSAFPSLLLKEWMGKHFPEFLETGLLIPHQSTKLDLNNFEQNNFSDYFDTSKFNLLHAGNLLDARSPKGLIEGFKLFMERNSIEKNNVRLLLIGPSSHFSNLIQSYQEVLPELIVKNENVDFDTVYQLQKQATVNIILEAKSEISPFLPGKFPHCVESNKMILSLAPSNCEVRRLLGKDYPYWSEIDDVESIAVIVEKMYFIWKQNPEDLLLNRIDLEQYLSAENLKRTIDSLNLTSSN